jgi:hypothetical protein
MARRRRYLPVLRGVSHLSDGQKVPKQQTPEQKGGQALLETPLTEMGMDTNQKKENFLKKPNSQSF